MGPGEAMVGLHYALTSPPAPSCILPLVLRSASQGCKQSAGQSAVQFCLLRHPLSLMGGFMNRGSHGSHFVHRPRYLGRASRMDGYIDNLLSDH